MNNRGLWPFGLGGILECKCNVMEVIFMECKRWVVECTCRADSWELVVKEFMDLYLFCEISVYPEDDIVVVRSNELSYNPTEDNTKVSADFDIFLDAIRNYANYGWPENDPVRIIERDYSMLDQK